MIKFVIAVSLALVATGASGHTKKLPRPTPCVAGNPCGPDADQRIRFEPYDNRKVYDVYARVGKATLIQFEVGEYIDPTKTDLSVLGIGYGDAWMVGVRQNNIIFKPRMLYPDTNLIVVTNKRTYAFDLKMAPSKHISTTYVLAFTYPQEERETAAARAENERKLAEQSDAIRAAKQAIIDAKAKITEESRTKKVVINTSYNWRGDDASLAPTAAWDDGRFTHLEYNHAGAVPVFYKVLSDGTEALINTNVNTDVHEKDETVLQEVVPVIRARLGSDVIEIVNKNFKVPEFNTTGMSEHGAVRIDKQSGAVRDDQ